MQQWPPSQQRPENFPAELPFLPGRAVAVGEQDGALVMEWAGVERPHDLVQQLIGAGATAGWTRIRGDEAPGYMPPLHVVMRMGDAVRTIDVLPAGRFSSVRLRQAQGEPQ